jgi:subtilisin
MSANWQIFQFGIDKIWSKTKGNGIKVAILDTGIMESHPDIKLNNIIVAKNFLYEGIDEFSLKNVNDNVGHGTHCTGIIAAQGIKASGVAPEVSLLIGKISDKELGINPDILFKGIEWAYTSEADVISVSVTVDKFDEDYQKKIKELDSNHKGILVGSLTDLGDLGFDSSSCLSSLDVCIGVGAVTDNFQMDDITARSAFLDILGPGHDIYSTWTNGEYETKTGCSMATPFVAGVIALILAYSASINKKITKNEILDHLKTSTTRYASFESLPNIKFPIIDPLSIFNLIN